jgi:hypothetical protein
LSVAVFGVALTMTGVFIGRRVRRGKRRQANIDETVPFKQYVDQGLQTDFEALGVNPV